MYIYVRFLHDVEGEKKFISTLKRFVLLLPMQTFFYFMPTKKYYLDGNFEKRIEFYYTVDNDFRIRFSNEKEFLGEVDLDLETIEEFILDLTFAIQKIKNEGGNNG